MIVQTSAPSGRQPAGALVCLSSFKGLLSVNRMDADQIKKQSTLRNLTGRAAYLSREIGAAELKIEFYAAQCSDGADAYRREMSPHIERNRASLAEIMALIAELEAMPVQMDLLAL